MRPATAALVAVIAGLAAPGSAQSASYPVNDDFLHQDPIVTDEIGRANDAQLDTATAEPGEPSHGATGPGRSAWWYWTAPRSGLAEFESCSNAFTPLVGVYTGFDVARLQPVATTAATARCELPSSYPFGTARRFEAVAGTSYRIATATDSPASGYVTAGVQMRPVGDDFSDAVALPVDVDALYLPIGMATVQPGEPLHGGRTATHSAWYAITPARSQRVRIEACTGNYTPVSSTVTVYRGTSLAGLTEVSSSRDAPGCGNSGHGGQVEALLEAGVAYRIALTQDDPTGAALQIVLGRSPRDDSATTPSKLSGGHLDLSLATGEQGEPAHAGKAGGRSRWESVTPDISKTYEVNTCTAPYQGSPLPDALLAVYEGAPGTPASALTPVTANDDGCPTGKGSLVRFRALAGHRYLVAIDSKGAAPGAVAMTVVRAPLYDDRDAAARFDGRTSDSSTTLATAEPGEPSHAGSPAAHSLWYHWVAPRSGNARVALCGASFDAVVAVYGIDPAAPALAAAGATTGCNDPGFGGTGTGPHFDLPVTGGRTYLVAIDGRGGATGTTGTLSMTMGAVTNDDVLDATSLADPNESNGVSFSSSAAATAQAAEPAHAGRVAEHSAWWRWTATRTGFVTLSSCSSSAPAASDTTLAVYTGDGLSDLAPVASADAGCGTAGGAGNAQLSFYAVAGAIYRIALDMHATTTGAGVLMTLPPANDFFASADDLAAGGYGNADLTRATREPGEPDHAGRSGGRSVWYSWTADRTGPGRARRDVHLRLRRHAGRRLHGRRGRRADRGRVRRRHRLL